MKQHTVIRAIKTNAADNRVLVSALIGNAQPSHTDIYLDGFIIHSADDTISSYDAGTEKHLKGKSLLVVTTARDIPANSDRIIVTHLLNIAKPDSTVIYDDTCFPNEIIIDSTKYFFI